MTPFRSPLHLHPTHRNFALLTLSLPTFLLTYRTMSTNTTTNSKLPSSSTTTPFPTRPYHPQHTTFPYPSSDFHRQDSSPDPDFYSTPRFVTHIDDNAIRLIRKYYASVLPRKGRILDLCSSWISHFPEELEALAIEGKKKDKKERGEEERLEVIGLGLNHAELAANPILSTPPILQDLNTEPTLPSSFVPPLSLTATTCVVSIDYLTRPLSVLTSVLERTIPGGTIHLVISNRCFPTKVVSRWLRLSEEERLHLVGDYLHFSGWRGVEVVQLCDGRGGAGGLMGMLGGRVDPVWVVRGFKGEGNGETREGKSEL